ncbi:MAG: helix-turn-helix domain-containing protein [Proteobacteria bacterium]|nr:helix-turn-helix domain-containing protein [Pseudomonadota bacterium]
MSAAGTQITPLGEYLKDRRSKLDPTAFGLSLKRRRTPGLRREEVAQRASVSATWYTWLEQGRGGAPSADVLDRISRALMLTDVEREHLFLIGLGHPPDVRYRETDSISPRLQRILDAMPLSPALVKNATWDVLAWNEAAAALLTDYAELPPERRNILRLMFTSQRTIDAQMHWEHVARYVVAVFRGDVARAGASERVKALVAELSAASPVFAKLWQSNDVQTHGEGTKHLRNPQSGTVAMEFSTFAVDGRPDLSMMIYNPATPQDAKIIAGLIKAHRKKR